MLEYLTIVVTILLLYIFYYLFRLISFKVVKIYLVFLEIVIVLCSINSIFYGGYDDILGIDDIVGVILNQIVLILLYIIIYKKDIERKTLFHNCIKK